LSFHYHWSIQLDEPVSNSLLNISPERPSKKEKKKDGSPPAYVSP
jgi:hypothetical protein